jgi:hypothetical protein
VHSNYLYHRGCPHEGPCSLGDNGERCWQVVQKAMSIIRPDDWLIEAWERMTFGGVGVRASLGVTQDWPAGNNRWSEGWLIQDGRAYMYFPGGRV